MPITAGHELRLTYGTPQGDDEATFYVRERHYGEFRRNWTLPTGVGEDDISAEFDNGLLEIRIKGGAVAAEPRSISIGSRSR